MQTNEPKILSKTLFGKESRFCLDEFLGRFGEICWFVKDAELPDANGYSTIVFQSDSKEKALARFGFVETDMLGIVEIK